MARGGWTLDASSKPSTACHLCGHVSNESWQPRQRSVSYHQGQLVGVSHGASQGCEAGAHLVVTVTAPDREHRHVPEVLCSSDPSPSDSRVEL